jgi:hypothetical protein
MHYRANRYRKLASASIALNQAISDFIRFGLDSCYIMALTMGASYSVRPTEALKDCPCLILCQAAHVYGCHLAQAIKFRWYVFHCLLLIFTPK